MGKGLVRRAAIIGALLFSCATPYNAPTEAPPDGGPSAPLAGDVEISPQELDFGSVTCGTESAPRVVVLRNLTDTPLSYEVSLPEGSVLAIKNDASGTIAPRGTVGIPVTATPRTAGDVVGSLLVTAGQSFMEVVARSKGAGAVLTLAPTVVDFGEVRKGTTATAVAVKIENTGTEPVTISAFEGNTPDLGVTLSEPLTVPAGGSGSVSAYFTAPTNPGQLETVLRPVVTGTVCAEPPTMTVRGASVDTSITLSAADFGVQPCNATTPPTKTITVTNYSNQPVTVESATLPASSRFQLSTTLPIAVPAAAGGAPSKATITVAALPTSALGKVEEDLTLSITGVPAPDGGPRKAKLRMDVQGAILTVSPTVLDFVSNGWLIDQKSYTVENKGNAAITISYDFVRTQGDAAWYPDRGPETVEPSKTVKMEMGFRPTGTGPWGATLTPRRESGAVACTPMPVATARGSRR